MIAGRIASGWGGMGGRNWDLMGIGGRTGVGGAACWGGGYNKGQDSSRLGAKGN